MEDLFHKILGGIFTFFFFFFLCLYFQVTAGNVLLDSEANAKSGMSKSEDKTGEMKYTSHSLEEVAEMVHGTISAYEIKVYNLASALFPS